MLNNRNKNPWKIETKIDSLLTQIIFSLRRLWRALPETTEGSVEQSTNRFFSKMKWAIKLVNSWRFRFRFVSWLVLRKISNEGKRLSSRVLVILPTALITCPPPFHSFYEGRDKTKLRGSLKIKRLGIENLLTYFFFFKFRTPVNMLTESVALSDGRTPVV
jgi:hypothetical protein